MTPKEFFAKYEGKTIDFDGYYGGQCMDVYHQFCLEVLKLEHPPAPAAKDLWNITFKDFEKIENTKDNYPLEGDIVVWGTKIGPYGHVAICQIAGIIQFTSMDQNWDTIKHCRFVDHTYKGVLGWLRVKTDAKPKEEPMNSSQSTMNPELLQFLQDFGVQNLSEARKKWDEERGFLAGDRKKVEDLQDAVKQAKAETANEAMELVKTKAALNAVIEDQKTKITVLQIKADRLEEELNKVPSGTPEPQVITLPCKLETIATSELLSEIVKRLQKYFRR